MTNLYIEPDLIAPRDWNAHYREIKQRLLARCAEGLRKPKPAPVVVEEPGPPPLSPRELALIASYREGDSFFMRTARQVCEEYGIKISDLRGPRRTKQFTAARRAFVECIGGTEKASLNSIGKFLGGRDHTTILNLMGKRRPRNYGGSTRAQQD